MRTWLTRLGWLAGIFLLVWLCIIIYWQGTAHMPSEGDLVLYLGVLPLAIAGTGWLLFTAATRPAKTPDVPANIGSQDPISQAQTAEAERGWTLQIVATSLQTSVGATTPDVLGALQAGPIQFELDPELKNDEGFPVFAARIADLDDADTQEALAEWQQTSPHPGLPWSEGQYRALHLAAASVNELASQVVQHPQALLFAGLQAEGRAPREDTVPSLRLITLWPREWTDPHQLLASNWIKSLVVAQGWPAHRVIVQGATQEQSNPIALLDSICTGAYRTKTPTLGILVACDSGIEQEYVDALAAQGKLFSGQNMQGRRPGEVAAALLFADATQSVLIGEGPFSNLHRASWASRDKSADERGRISAELLGRLVGLALDASKVDATKIMLISADHDHHPSRESELAEMLVEKFPELDVAKDAVKVAQACGSMHQVTTTAALCLAHQYVLDEQLPVLCASLHDPFWRAAVVLNLSPDKQMEDQLDDQKSA